MIIRIYRISCNLSYLYIILNAEIRCLYVDIYRSLDKFYNKILFIYVYTFIIHIQFDENKNIFHFVQELLLD